jgi:hypothetical protein
MAATRIMGLMALQSVDQIHAQGNVSGEQARHVRPAQRITRSQALQLGTRETQHLAVRARDDRDQAGVSPHGRRIAEPESGSPDIRKR